tara:strand:+ start:146 stop:679 length:534 start_codon:yes stop_codon:yes gene_type:complete
MSQFRYNNKYHQEERELRDNVQEKDFNWIFNRIIDKIKNINNADDAISFAKGINRLNLEALKETTSLAKKGIEDSILQKEEYECLLNTCEEHFLIDDKEVKREQEECYRLITNQILSKAKHKRRTCRPKELFKEAYPNFSVYKAGLRYNMMDKDIPGIGPATRSKINRVHRHYKHLF